MSLIQETGHAPHRSFWKNDYVQILIGFGIASAIMVPMLFVFY